MNLPCGIVPVLQTPFDVAGAIDWASLSRLIEDGLSAGALVPFVAGECAQWTSFAAAAGSQACLIAPPASLRDDAAALLAFLREAGSPLPLIVAMPCPAWRA